MRTRHHAARGQHGDLGSSRQVQSRLDDAVVAQRNAQSRVRTQQAALTQRHALEAAAREHPHCRGAAADVGAVPDDDALGYPALHHRAAQRTGVVVDEAGVHDRRPLGQVGAQADIGRIADAHARGQHIVGHARELVDRVHLNRVAELGAQAGARDLEVLGGAGSDGGPHDIGQAGEDPVQIDCIGQGQAVGQDVETQVGARHRLRGIVQVGPAAHDGGVNSTCGVLALHGRQGGEQVGVAVGGLIAQNRPRVPDVEGVAVVGHGRQAETPCSASRHGAQPYGTGSRRAGPPGIRAGRREGSPPGRRRVPPDPAAAPPGRRRTRPSSRWGAPRSSRRALGPLRFIRRVIRRPALTPPRGHGRLR